MRRKSEKNRPTPSYSSAGRSQEYYFRLDLRAEKLFRFDRDQFSRLMDIYNVFNNATVTSVQTSMDLSSFEDVLGMQSPRVIQLGVRFSF